LRKQLELSPTPAVSSATVLLVGEQYDPLKPALLSLAGRRDFRFVCSPDGSLDLRHASVPSLVVVLPGSKYLTLAESQRANKSPLASAAVLICIGHDDLEREDLFEEAADFLVVPCSAAELEKRLRRLLLRKNQSFTTSQIRVGKITLDLDTFEVRLDGHRLELAWMEFQLLKFLMQNPGKVFTRDQLLANVWGVENFGGTRTVDVHIRRLRNKLEVVGDRYFRTVKNVGYGLLET
jgi:DNA-binding response OmpR family regulator